MEKEKSLLSGGERPATKGKGSCVLLLLPACWAVIYLFFKNSFSTSEVVSVFSVSACSRSFASFGPFRCNGRSKMRADFLLLRFKDSAEIAEGKGREEAREREREREREGEG